MNQRTLVPSLFLVLLAASVLTAQKTPALRWDPPKVDAPVPSLSSKPPCSLADVLKQAGARAEELIAHLQNFDAHEQIRYERTDEIGMPEEFADAKFDYVVDFGGNSDVPVVHETRTLLTGAGDAQIRAIVDRGLPALALIFYPTLQSDYDMRCEGSTQWDKRSAWVIHFRQIKGRRPRTFGIRTTTTVFPLGLKGRAWIAADSGNVMHVETNLVDGIVTIGLQGNAVSVEYAPVKFLSQNVEVWLPQSAVAYYDYGERRMIVGHTFTEFQLFSVQTQQVIEKPKIQ